MLSECQRDALHYTTTEGWIIVQLLSNATKRFFCNNQEGSSANIAYPNHWKIWKYHPDSIFSIWKKNSYKNQETQQTGQWILQKFAVDKSYKMIF